MIATRDIADAAATALKARNWQGVVVRELLGPRDLTFPEATRILGESIGKPDLRYIHFSYADEAKALVQAGISKSFADLYVEMTRAFNEGKVMSYEARFIQLNQHRIYTREYSGEEPTIILMHGFPDNVHLYDRLISKLSPPRRIVTFDFLGWGASDKPIGYPYTATNQVLELDAVVKRLKLKCVVLVAHDASGPPAIDWAIGQAERVAGLVLLNTYYCEMLTLRAPEAIWLFSTPLVRSIARHVSQMFGNLIFRRMFRWQVGKFFRDADVRDEFIPLLYEQFDAIPSTRPAFFRLNEDLLPAIRSRSKMIPKLKEFKRPVRIIFGDADPYLNKGVAQRFHQLFQTSELFLLPGARHYVQMDEPDEVARLILSMPLMGNE